MIAAYVRVSSLAQSYAMQKHAIEGRARARGERIDTWYEEKQSAKTMQREQLERLRSAIRARIVKRLYVYRLDRLARTGIRDTFEFIEEARSHNCELVSISDGFDLDGPAADVVIAVMAWAAKQERLVRNERIAATRAAYDAAGKPWGRPQRMTQAELASARALRKEGKSIRHIAAALGIPRATLATTLKRATRNAPVSASKR